MGALIGRLLMALIFFSAAFGKLTNFEATVLYMASHGIPYPFILCVLAAAVEILGGLSLALGFYGRWGAVVLAVFLIPVTLIFHGSADQRTQLLKNLAIIGGLLVVAARGPGALSLDGPDS